MILLVAIIACHPPLTLEETDTGEPVVDTGQEQATLEVRVVDEAAAPLVDVPLQLCAWVCRQCDTDADGRCTFVDIEPLTHSLHILGEAPRATPLFTVTLAEGEQRQLQVAQPGLGPEVVVPDVPGEAELAPGLWIDLGFGALETTSVWAAAIPVADRPPLEVEGTVVGAWYLHPHEDALSPVPFRVEAGARAWAMDLVDPAWVDLGTLDGEGRGSLPVLSTLVVVD